jgi:hypothetical protein
MEHFLLTTGDLSNVYEKRTRSTASTKETYDIGNLSLLIVFNNRECYPEGVRYFDDVFQRATTSRFLPLKLEGAITQQVNKPLNPEKVAEENAEYYKSYIRSVMYYRTHWQDEVAACKNIGYGGAKYGLSDRWSANFTTIAHFIRLYAKSSEEAKMLCDKLYERHKGYLAMVSGSNGFTDLRVIDEKVSF